MSASARLVSGLVRAEDRLRADGLTGSQAFTALLDALRARLGDDVEPVAAAREAVADLPLDAGLDLVGLAYERFFADLFKGRRGQYFTPQPIIDLLLSRVPLARGLRVLDPTCGSGGLLVAAGRRGATVHGIDVDPLVAQLATLNLRLAGIGGTVERADVFRAEVEPADVVVANPPFSVEVRDPEVLGPLGLGDRALSDHVFMRRLEDWVVPGGHAAVVLPWTVVTNRSTAELRERIDSAWVRRGLCALPEGVFRPFGGAASRACLLWLHRRPAPVRPWAWSRLDDPGYDVRRQALVPTSPDQLNARIRGEGWESVAAASWVPATRQVGRALSELAELRPLRAARGPHRRLDLADTDRSTGEVTGVTQLEAPGSRKALVAGDVLVSRLRPELGNVAVVPMEGAWAGSPEWVALHASEHAQWLLHALRTDTWRAGLPLTGGQTRPRTTADAILESCVAWPGEATARRVGELSSQIVSTRARLREALLRLQYAVDRFAQGELTSAELDAVVEDLARGIGYSRGQEEAGCAGPSAP